jgi:hypothetical protein
VGEKKYPSRTHLDSGRVRVPPAGKKSSPYPSGRVPDTRTQIAIPNPIRVLYSRAIRVMSTETGISLISYTLGFVMDGSSSAPLGGHGRPHCRLAVDHSVLLLVAQAVPLWFRNRYIYACNDRLMQKQLAHNNQLVSANK